MNTIKERNLNLDLIRCVALLMVPIMHSLDHTGLYDQMLYGAANQFMIALKTLFTCCIPLYVMLSGYLCSRKTLSARYYLGLIRILGIYLLCGAACLIFEQCSGRADRSLVEMVSALLNFNCSDYAWYIMMYFGLFLIIPFLNMAYHGLKTQKQKRILVVTFFALSILPSLLNLYVQFYSLWWVRLYPLCYYFTGAYLREYMPQGKPGKWAAALLVFLAAYSVFFYFHSGANGAALIGVYQDTFPVYLLSVLLFICLFRLPLGAVPGPVSALLRKVSDLTLPAYLLTWITDSLIYPRLMAAVPAGPARYPWLLLTVPLSLISALLMAQVVEWLFSPINRLTGRLAQMSFFSRNDPIGAIHD